MEGVASGPTSLIGGDCYGLYGRNPSDNALLLTACWGSSAVNALSPTKRDAPPLDNGRLNTYRPSSPIDNEHSHMLCLFLSIDKAFP